jgi:hypothetical protein
MFSHARRTYSSESLAIFRASSNINISSDFLNAVTSITVVRAIYFGAEFAALPSWLDAFQRECTYDKLQLEGTPYFAFDILQVMLRHSEVTILGDNLCVLKVFSALSQVG